MQNLLAIGKIVGVHGIKGNLKVKPYAGEATLFSTERSLLIRDESGRESRFALDWAEPHQKGLRVGLKGLDQRTAAEALVGSEIFIAKEDLPEPEDGSYYWFDIIGLSVRTTDDDWIGVVDAILETGSNDVYIVKKGSSETLIPGIASVVLDIDLKQRVMRVKLPEGL